MPPAGMAELVPMLQQLTQTLGALVAQLQGQATGGGASTGAGALGGGPGVGQIPGQAPGSGCGCGGASGAVAGVEQVGQAPSGAKGAPDAEMRKPDKGPKDMDAKGGGANGAPDAAPPGGAAGSGKGAQLVAEVRKYLGTKYVFGGEDPSGFDCSGLMQYVAKKLGITIPRTADQQAKAGKEVSKGELQPGDMVFFNTSGGGVSHVGMYIGDGKMIHSPKTGDVVKVSSINDSYYSPKFVTARRFT